MSEQMEVYVKARREWLPVSYLGERKADGITLVVWSSGTGVEFFDDDEMKNRLRPAISRGREQNRKFVPTPHEPIPGVTLWQQPKYASDSTSGCTIRVDGVVAGVFYSCHGIEDGTENTIKDTEPLRVSNPRLCIESLTAFRDRIRQQRNAKAEPKDAPRTWTRAEIISIVESVK